MAKNSNRHTFMRAKLTTSQKNIGSIKVDEKRGLFRRVWIISMVIALPDEALNVCCFAYARGKKKAQMQMHLGFFFGRVVD